MQSAPPPSQPDPLLGATLGPCRIEALLGRGGMGAVYRAHHIPLDRQVALKVISPDWVGSPEAAESLLCEARLAARLDDPRIVQVYDVGVQGGQAYIVMQLISGLPLDLKVSRDGPLSQEEALRVIKEVVRALIVAHRRDVVHRDIKPGNIMLGADGSVRLMDFGLSVAAGKSGGAAGGVAAMGTFDFMAPEQGFGAPPHPRMDLYSLGATYFYALAGRPPFAAGGAAEILLQHRDAPVPDVRELRREATEAAAGLIRRLMAKDPEARPASAEEVLRELDSPRMLLDVDSSGSPFRILPPPVEAKVGFDASDGFAPMAAPAEPEPAAPAPPPAPPPPPPVPPARRDASAAKVGTAVAFVLVVATHCSGAGGPDWAAAGLFAMVVLASLVGLRDWRALTRVPAAVAVLACMLGAFYHYGVGSFALPPALPGVETLILAGLGLAAGGAGLYLGLAETGPSDRLTARGLLAASAGTLFLAACASRLAPEAGWLPGIRAVARADGRIFLSSGGLWRWAGLIILCAGWRLLRRHPWRVAAADPGPISNWNRPK